MSELTSFFFGGSETESQQSSRPIDVTPEELKRLREPFARVLEQLLGAREGDPLAGIPTPSGPRVASITPEEVDALSRLSDISNDPARAGLLDRTLKGDFLTRDSNPFLGATIRAAQRPTLEGLEETLSRTLPGRFTAAGQFVQPGGSSAFDRAAAIATRGASQSLADIATNISFGAFESERGRQQEAIQLSQEEIKVGIQNLQAQALPRLIEDLGIERGRAEFAQRMQQVLQVLAAVSGNLAFIGQESQGTSSRLN